MKIVLKNTSMVFKSYVDDPTQYPQVISETFSDSVKNVVLGVTLPEGSKARFRINIDSSATSGTVQISYGTSLKEATILYYAPAVDTFTNTIDKVVTLDRDCTVVMMQFYGSTTSVNKELIVNAPSPSNS